VGGYREDFISSTQLGTYYHHLKKKGGSGSWEHAITHGNLVLQLHQLHYLRYVVDNEKKIISAYHIYSMLMDRYIYTYNEKGALTNVDNVAYETPNETSDL